MKQAENERARIALDEQRLALEEKRLQVDTNLIETLKNVHGLINKILDKFT